MPSSNIFTWKREHSTTLGYRSVAFVFCLLLLKKRSSHCCPHHKQPQKMGRFLCLTGSSKPGAHLSGLSWLTFLQLNYFPLVPFWSRLFLLPLLLSSLILSPFLLHSQNLLLPTVSFHSIPCFPNSTAHHYYVRHLYLSQIVIRSKKTHMNSKKSKKEVKKDSPLLGYFSMWKHTMWIRKLEKEHPT